MVERLPPPAFGLRARPRVEDRDARRVHRVHLHRRRRRERDDLEAEFLRGLVEVARRDVANDERAAVEVRAAGVERLLGRLEVRVLQLVAQRGERVVAVVR